MNPQVLIDLMNVAAQLVTLIEQLKAGVVSESTAWANSRAEFMSAVSNWNEATGTQGAASGIIAQNSASGISATQQSATFIQAK